MRGRSFWVLVFILMVVASHLAYVLYASRLAVPTNYQSLSAAIGTNKMQSLSEEQALLLSLSSDRELVHAACAYDLTSGPVQLSAMLPDRYWSVSIYSTIGDVIYTLNDRQAKAYRITIIISRSGTEVPKQLAASPSGVDGEMIQVVSETAQGIAVLRSALTTESQRAQTAARMDRSRCGVMKS